MAACGGNKKPTSSGKETTAPAESTAAGDESGTTEASVDETAASGSDATAATQQGPGKTNGKTTTTVAKGKTTTAKATSKPSNKVELPKLNVQGKTVELLTSDSPETDQSKETIARFKELYGATLKMTNVEWNSLQTVLNSRVMAKNPPDVTIVRNADYYTFQLGGILQDITGKIDFNSALWKDVKGLNESMMMGDKQYYAVVGSSVGWYLWYNKSIMLDNGIVDTPDKLYEQGKWTVSAMRSLAKELTVRDGEKITQYGLGSDYGTLANSLQISRGAKLIKRSGTTFSSNINDTAVADAYNLLYDLYAADKCMTPIDQQINMFAKGRCAMLVEGSWLTMQKSMLSLKKKGTIGLVPFPKWDGQEEYQLADASSIGIPKGAKNTDLGMAYIHCQRYSTIDETQRQKNRNMWKNQYAMTDKELDYEEATNKKGVIPSWYGIPNGPTYLMAMHVAYGNSWATTVEKYAPDLKKAVDDLNAMVKKG